MKKLSMLSAVAALVAVAATAPAQADFTMAATTVTNKLTTAGCKIPTVGGTASVLFNTTTFTYSMVLTGSSPAIASTGTWTYLTNSSGTTYSIYMKPYNDNNAPGDLRGMADPDNTPDIQDKIPGSINDMFDSMDVALKAGCSANAKLGPAGNTVAIVRPTVLISKNILSAKVDGSGNFVTGSMTLALKGKSQNQFKGQPSSAPAYGAFSSTISFKGTMTGAKPVAAPLSIATTTM